MAFKIQDTNGKVLPDYPQDVELADITVYVHDSMMLATHNYPCYICKTNKAVYSMNIGIFEPCWECQKKGYKIVKVTKIKSWFSKLFK